MCVGGAIEKERQMKKHRDIEAKKDQTGRQADRKTDSEAGQRKGGKRSVCVCVFVCVCVCVCV